MAIHYKLLKGQVKKLSNHGKYYARVVNMGEVNMQDIMSMVQANCSAKRSDVIAVMTEFMEILKDSLQNGKSVHLDGIGKFRIAIESNCVDCPEDFQASRDIRNVRCKFMPDGKWVNDPKRHLVYPLLEGCEFKEI